MSATILVPVDMEHDGGRAEIVQVATALAVAAKARLHLMTVVEAPPVLVSEFLPDRYQRDLREHTRLRLQTLADSVSTDVVGTETVVRFGSVYREILACAESIHADLIVMGSHNPTVSDYLFGGNAARVLRHAECSIHIVRPEANNLD